jgi:hypothetical protein
MLNAKSCFKISRQFLNQIRHLAKDADKVDVVKKTVLVDPDIVKGVARQPNAYERADDKEKIATKVVEGPGQPIKDMAKEGAEKIKEKVTKASEKIKKTVEKVGSRLNKEIDPSKASENTKHPRTDADESLKPTGGVDPPVAHKK